MDFCVPEANFVLQIIILVVLFVSLVFKSKRKYFLHGAMILLAVILNAVSFFWVMWPSLQNMREFLLNNPSSRIALVVVPHAILGTVAEILGIVLVVSWGFRASTQKCARKKRLMRATLVLWLLALLLGILYYAFAYLGY